MTLLTEEGTVRRSFVHSFLSAGMDLLVVFAVVLVGGLVARFFGAVSAHPVGRLLASVAERASVPFGLPGIKTPYGGVFDVDIAATIVAVLFVEWVLAGIRRRS